MEQTLIFATSNVHKVAEVRSIIGVNLQILSLADIGLNHFVLEETSNTLRGNAEQKARALYDVIDQTCFAEDTGLEVDVLHGAPGVFTARYASEDCTPEENMTKLLHELSTMSLRTARFRTVIALIIKGKLHFFEGVAEGRIAHAPRGIGGFGYDPVFIPEGYQETFAELPGEIKNSLSHRALAVRKMLAFLAETHT